MSGKTWVFGGTGNFKRQLSSVGQCQLQTEGTLPYDLFRGAVNTVVGLNGVEAALLRFDYHSKDACYMYVQIYI